MSESLTYECPRYIHGNFDLLKEANQWQVICPVCMCVCKYTHKYIHKSTWFALLKKVRATLDREASSRKQKVINMGECIIMRWDSRICKHWSIKFSQ